MAQAIDMDCLQDLLNWTLLSLDNQILSCFVSAITPSFNFESDLSSRIIQAIIYFYDRRSK